MIAGAIDKYAYITIHSRFADGFLLKYSQLEDASSLDDIRHPIIREAIRLAGVEVRNLEIVSMADIPAGTGLGSSGSFTTALLKALHAHKKHLVHRMSWPRRRVTSRSISWVNREANKINTSQPSAVSPASSQTDDSVKAWPLAISEETLFNLEDNLLLFFTGYSRSASSILKEQADKSKVADNDVLQTLHFIKELGLNSKQALESADLEEFGRLMNVHWEWKKKRSSGISNGKIDKWYMCAMANGAPGGKVIGAGGGGFLMFYTSDKVKLRHAMREQGLKEVRFRFDFESTRVVSSN